MIRRAHLLRWRGSVLSLLASRTRPCSRIYAAVHGLRNESTATASLQAADDVEHDDNFTDFPLHSAKLASLHARLSLPSRLPYQTLARTLVDASADPDPHFNNASFSMLGNDLLGYYTSEYLLCKYPRLPMPVLFAAMWAYLGPPALANMTHEWGVEAASAPGEEVDPGVLQFSRVAPNAPEEEGVSETTRPNDEKEAQVKWRRGMSSRTVYDDAFGDLRTRRETIASVTLDRASAKFVCALAGAIYLHAGNAAFKRFFTEHFLSRTLPMHALFDFRQPTRDLSRLCAREGFESPVARIVSETGRRSRHPVFVVGVYSGRDKLGEASGSSLDEARIRAAVVALKSWYLYCPMELRLPSETEDGPTQKEWKPLMVDQGEVVA